MNLIDNDLDSRITRSNLNEYSGKNKHVNQIDPLVSIVVETYQHVDYIDECIKSILMQKTSFPIEIIVGEDESTDGTREKCIEYANQYTDKIRLFLRSRKDVFYVNGFATGKFNSMANQAAARGKYIACCEGDDYWIDPYKLEKQVRFMENNPDCSLCCHASYKMVDGKISKESVVRPHTTNKVFTVEEVILGQGDLFATSSMVYLAEHANKMPDFSENATFCDYPLAIYLSIHGEVYYIDELMSVYRMYVDGSWTMMTISSPIRCEFFYKEYIDILEKINKYTKRKYEIQIGENIQNAKTELFIIAFNRLFAEGKYKELIYDKEFKETYNLLSKRLKITIFIKHNFPAIAKIIIYIRRILGFYRGEKREIV